MQWKDVEGRTPLIIACLRHDRFDVAKALIDFGANVNAYRPGIALNLFNIFPRSSHQKEILSFSNLPLYFSSLKQVCILNINCHI